MANFNATNAASLAKTPPERVEVNKLHGRIRYFESTYDAAVHGVMAIGDTITWGPLPVGARVVGHLSELNWSTGVASATLTVGDAADADRHLAATAITTAGVAVPKAQSASGATFETSDASGSATDNCTLTSTLAGAATGAAQKITLRVAYVLD